jgi:hypothetical protein
MLILGILAAVALPKYFDYSAQAQHAAIVGFTGGVQEGYANLKLAYLTMDTADLPPDSNGDGYPDHLGDEDSNEPTLLDAVLYPPYVPEPRGWKPYTATGFPIGGRVYMYYHDADGDDVYEFPDEAYINYDNQTGRLLTYVPDP